MSQPREPRNEFIEFAQVWGGSFDAYLEGVIMYDSKNGSKYMLRHFQEFRGCLFSRHCLEPL